MQSRPPAFDFTLHIRRVCDDMIEHYVADNVLRPLARAISAK